MANHPNMEYLRKASTATTLSGVSSLGTVFEGPPVADYVGEKYVTDDEWAMGDPGEAKIFLNVGGVRHETYLSTLKNIQGTRLAKLAEFHEKALNNGMARDGEYFFDRHPGVFHSIIDFYRTEELHYPLDVCGAVVRRELKFWGIDEGCFKTCCVTQFSSFTDNENLLNNLRSQLESGPSAFGGWIQDIVKEADVKSRIWTALNTPRSSILAMLYAILAMSVVITSLIGYCLETVEHFQDIENVTCIVNNQPEHRVLHVRLTSLEWVDIFCSIFIFIELLVKLICAPNKLRFIRSTMTIMDMLSLVPSIVHMIMFWPHIHCNFALTTFINVTMMLRVLRVFRMVYYLRHYGPFRVMLYSIRSAMNAMVMLTVFMAVSVIFFGALVFYAERVSTHETEADNDFQDLTSGFWWAIVTLTTVGYGDLIVRTSLGYATGAVAAISGLVMLAFVVPIISNQFTLLYNFDVAMKNVHQHCQVKRRRRNLSTSFSFKEIKRTSFRSSRRTDSRSSTQIAESHRPLAGKRRKAVPDAEQNMYSDTDIGSTDFEHCLQSSPGSRRRLSSTATTATQSLGYESDMSSLPDKKGQLHFGSKVRGRCHTMSGLEKRTTSPSRIMSGVANGIPQFRRQSNALDYGRRPRIESDVSSGVGTSTSMNDIGHPPRDPEKKRTIKWSETDTEGPEQEHLIGHV